MKPEGVFVFIDDDELEHEMFRRSMNELGYKNKIISAYNGEEAYTLMKNFKEKIFLIICDINMPKINGLELKRMIENTAELKIKAIPFVFHSTNTNSIMVKEAYALGIQGFIEKANDASESVVHLDILIKFWSTSIHPNSAY